MVRKICLHQHLAGEVAAAGAAGNLLEQREEALRRAKFRAVERIVGAEDADQRQSRESHVPLASIWVPTRMSTSPASIGVAHGAK